LTIAVDAGGSFGAVGGDEVVGAGHGALVAHGADGDDEGVVAGGADGAVAVDLVGATVAVRDGSEATLVAGGDDDGDAGAPGAFDGLAEGVCA
jgi:hypothetical protein